MSQKSCEVWRDIPGYEGRYQASNQGQVRSMDRTVWQTNRYGALMPRRLRGKILRPQKYPNNYLFVQLGKDHRGLLHRLIAITFIGPDSAFQVNHKNGVRTDNRVDNLEWVTCSENHLHAHRSLPRKKHALTRQVLMRKGAQILEFDSVQSAANSLRVRPGSISSAALRGHRCRGYEVFYESH